MSNLSDFIVPAPRVPVGALVPIYSDALPNTIVDGVSTYLKTGVVDAATTYPLAPAGSYMAQSVATRPDLTGSNPVFGGTKFVIPTTDGVVVSSDAFAWTFVALAGVTKASACAFVNSLFIVFQANGDKCFTSTDAVTWTQRTLPVSAAWAEVAHNGTRYVAVNGTTSVAVSTDAVTWSSVSVTNIANGIAYGSSKFVIVGGVYCRTSTDGLTWTLQTTPTPPSVTTYTWKYVAWNGSVFLAVTDIAWDSGSTCYQTYGMKSSDGVTWANHTLPTTMQGWGYWGYCYGIGVAGGNFYLGGSGYADNRIGWSGNTTAVWTSLTGYYRQYAVPFPAGLSKGKIATNGAVWLWGGGLMSLNSGANWGGTDFQQALNTSGATPACVSYGGGLYISAAYVQHNNFGDPVTYVGASKDGVNFNALCVALSAGVGANAQYKSAIFFNGKHCVGGATNQIYTTADGISWAQTGSGSTNTSVQHVAGAKAFAMKDSYDEDGTTNNSNSGYAYTTDATTWAGSTFPIPSPYVVAYGGGKWMMLAGNGGSSTTAYTSSDGINAWTGVGTFSGSGDSRGLVYAYSAFIRFGKDGSISKSADLGVTWAVAAPKNGTFANCDWAKSDGSTIIAGANNSGDYLLSKDGTNFFVRKAPLKQLNKWGSIVNGKVLSSTTSPFGVLDTSGDYVLNDRAQFSVESLTKLGTQLYMRVS